MTRPDVYRDAIVSLRYTGPERRSQPRSDRSDFLPALLVALYTTAALIAGVIAMEGLPR